MAADPSAYRAHLATGSTTRARCWRIKRVDGVHLGFTDHDRPLTFGGLTFEPDAAVAASEAQAKLGLGADDQEIVGALASDAITEADVRRGRYDGAEVVVWDVNWSDPDQRVEVAAYLLGEVERTEDGFRAEVRSRSTRLEKRAGRFCIPYCDATLGDARCGVDVSGEPFMRSGSVGALLDGGFSTDDIPNKDTGFFDGGLLTWTGGPNAGLAFKVREHVNGASRWFYLWRDPPFPIQAGDAFEVVAGCNKTWDHCVTRFGNGPNFRGFPHMPGQGYPATFARRGERGQDGGSANPKPKAEPRVYTPPQFQAEQGGNS